MYLLADSSPQAGEDYLLSTALMIASHDLERCFVAASYMRSSWDELLDAYKQEDREKLSNIALLRDEYGQTLKSCMALHRFLPMALGSGASGLEHKTTALARAMFAETQTIPALHEVLSQVVSMTSDMGTEMGIANLAGFTLKEILPSWAVDSELEPDGEHDAFAQPQPDGPDAEGSYFLPRGIAIPGLNHIVDNMVSKCNECLESWEPWLLQFRPLISLLHHDHLRKRFVSSCLLDTQHSWTQRHFQVGMPQFAEWRWGSTVTVLERLLPLKKMLRAAWDPDRFRRGAQDAEEVVAAPEQPDVDHAVLTSAIRSDSFWNFGAMVLAMNKAGTDFLEWVEGCSCHPFRRTALRVHEAREPAAQLEEDALTSLVLCRRELGLDGHGDGRGFLPCPLAGLRSVELASGAFEDQLASLFNLSKEDLLVEMSPMPEHETVTILQEFERGKNHMIATFMNKMQHWTMLLWKLAALAQPDQAKARQVASSLKNAFDESDQREDLHHRVTWSLMTSQQFREELDAFVSGRPLQNLPKLYQAAQELSFMPVAGASVDLRTQVCIAVVRL